MTFPISTCSTTRTRSARSPRSSSSSCRCWRLFLLRWVRSLLRCDSYGPPANPFFLDGSTPQHAGYNWSPTIRPLQALTEFTTVAGYLAVVPANIVRTFEWQQPCVVCQMLPRSAAVPGVLLPLARVRGGVRRPVRVGTPKFSSQRMAGLVATPRPPRPRRSLCNDAVHPALPPALERFRLRGQGEKP